MENDRVQDVLYLICHEFSNTEISNLMCLSKRTIEYYRIKISTLLNVKNYIGIVKYALESGIIENVELQEKWKKAIIKKMKN